jgi:hypothetical protein
VTFPDQDALNAHVRKMLQRLGTDRKSYVQQMRRFALCAQTLVQPRGDINAALGSFTDAELYGGIWLLLITDIFRSEGGRARFASEVVGLTEEEWKDVLRVTTMVSARYFGQ